MRIGPLKLLELHENVNVGLVVKTAVDFSAKL